MSNDFYKAIDVWSNTVPEKESLGIFQNSLSLIEYINQSISFLFNFVLQMNSKTKLENKNIIGFSRVLALIIVVAFLGLIIILPTILIFIYNYKSPHDDVRTEFVKKSNFQNYYIMITSSIWIIMFCVIILFSQIKAI